MTDLIICRGIPASGKSTYASVWATASKGRIRSNRDDLRFSMYGVYFGENIDENMVTKIQHAQIREALKNGVSVIVDDTNLVEKFVKSLVKIGHNAGARISVKDFAVDLHEALRRNALRDRKVPEDVIRKMHDRFSNRKDVNLTAPVVRKYEGTPAKPDAYLFDIDGTLAKMAGRSPYEWHRVGEDAPIDHVVKVADALFSMGYSIVFLSGRDGSCYDQTITWLNDYVLTTDELFMRKPGDMRPDNIIKAELFDNHVRDNYNVQAVFDDRNQVVDMWRAMGVPCYQVAPGDF